MEAMDIVVDSFGEHFGKKAELARVPVTGTFELSPMCNLDCKMCYVRKNREEVEKLGGLLDVDFWSSRIEEAVNGGMLFCLLTGGEPFLYKNFRELCERVCKLPIYLSINTNATMLDEETVKWLKTIHVKRINISLYGASRETYEKLCGDGSAFDRVIRAMELLNQYQITFEVHTTLTPANIGDYDGIIQICNAMRTYLKMSYYMYPPYRKGAEHIGKNDGRFQPKEAAKIAFRYRRDSHIEKEAYAKYIENCYMQLIHPETIPSYGDASMRCKGGLCTFWVDWRGNISVCGVMEPGDINLRHNTFAEGWEKVKKAHDAILIAEKCRYCNKQKICPVCAAAAYCETGEVSGVPEYCCEFSEEYEKIIKNEYERLQNEGVFALL